MVEHLLEHGDVDPYELSPAELERLAILSEECGEVQQIIGKILRHGYESYSPLDETKETNRKILTRELGDLFFAIAFVAENNDINHEELLEASVNKSQRIQKYLHHNKID